MLSYAPVKLKVKRIPDGDGPEILLAIATGFFWQHQNAFYLITNWHNASGRDANTEKCLSDTGALPTHFEMPLLLKAGERDGLPIAARKRFNIPLLDSGGTPIWLEHPVFGHKVDVVVIEISEVDDALVSRPINTFGDFVDFEPAVGDDVFVLGYPGGLDGGNELAIWKRGSIASQPGSDIDGLPKLLIDTATRKGMSGAPVIARRSGIIVPRGAKTPSEGLTGQEIIGTAETFLGVYSGRVGDDEFGVQLGVVWKSRVLDEIIGAKANQAS